MKFFGLAPTMLMPVMGRLLLVVFETVTVCTGEAVPAGIGVTNVTPLGEKPTDDGVPLPVTVTVCVGLFGSSSWTVTVAERLPVAVGSNVTRDRAGRIRPQARRRRSPNRRPEKSPGLAPPVVVLP